MAGKRDVIVILWNIRSLFNVGSIFRTADGAGVSKIYLAGYTPAPVDVFGKYRPQIAKVSLGAEKSVKWEKAAKSAQGTVSLIKKIKKEGYQILAVEQAKRSINIFSASGGSALGGKFKQANRSDRFCLIMGNEVSGLPPIILKSANKILEIPMRGKKESLNVSVAFGIVAYLLAPQNY
ncbi:MAG: TrmH family RNA methyltransferase [Patescibacteria group bacterium]|nr:TrmH family RNA methyltransferase [Patescibacteria group bacterium]